MANIIVSLAEIWESPYEEIITTLESQGLQSVSKSYDRAHVAVLYYNEGLLAEEEKIWVAHPNFVSTVVSEPTLAAGLHRLQSPYMVALLHLATLVNRAYPFLEDDDPLTLEMSERGFVTDEDVIKHDNARVSAGRYIWEYNSEDLKSHVGLARWVYLGQEMDYNPLPPDANLSDDPEVDMAREKLQDALSADATLDDLIALWIRSTWFTLLGSDMAIRTTAEKVIRKTPIFSKSALNVETILNKLLDTDLIAVHPMVRCFFLYSIWELIKISNAGNVFPKIERLFWEKAHTYECLDMFKSEIDTTELTEPLLPVLGPILQDYLEPPPREVVIARIRAALDFPPIEKIV